MCVNLLGLLLLKCNENAAFFYKTTQNKVKGPFFLKSALFVMLFLVAAFSFQIRS